MAEQIDNLHTTVFVTSPRGWHVRQQYWSHMTPLRNYLSPLLLFLFKQTQRHQATPAKIQSNNKDEFTKECYMLFRYIINSINIE